MLPGTFDSTLSLTGSSFEYTTFNLGIFLFLNSFLITLASGHTLVLKRQNSQDTQYMMGILMT